MYCKNRLAIAAGLLTIVLAAGCNSPYHADRGALFGGLLGAGTGALIGDAVGNTGAGAAIGAGVGALTGAAIGDSIDQVEAENRAMIAAQLGREVRAGAVTIDDVMMMTQAGVDDQLIINHIRAHGVARVPGPHELVTLNQQGVSTAVIAVMQEPPARPQPETVVIEKRVPAPVIVEEYHYGTPYYRYPPPYRRPRTHIHGRGPRVGWGMSFHN